MVNEITKSFLEVRVDNVSTLHGYKKTGFHNCSISSNTVSILILLQSQ